MAALREMKEVWKLHSSQNCHSHTIARPGQLRLLLHLFGYVPTSSASRVENDQFLNNLQQALDSTLSSERGVIVGP